MIGFVPKYRNKGIISNVVRITLQILKFTKINRKKSNVFINLTPTVLSLLTKDNQSKHFDTHFLLPHKMHFTELWLEGLIKSFV